MHRGHAAWFLVAAIAALGLASVMAYGLAHYWPNVQAAVAEYTGPCNENGCAYFKAWLTYLQEGRAKLKRQEIMLTATTASGMIFATICFALICLGLFFDRLIYTNKPQKRGAVS